MPADSPDDLPEPESPVNIHIAAEWLRLDEITTELVAGLRALHPALTQALDVNGRDNISRALRRAEDTYESLQQAGPYVLGRGEYMDHRDEIIRQLTNQD